MKSILIALVLGMAVVFGTWDLGATKAELLGVVVMMVVLWSSSALPLGVVSMLPLLLFPMLGIMDFNSVSSNYSKSIIFLFLGGFMLSIAMEKSALHLYLSQKILGYFSTKLRSMLYGMAITSALLSAILSNTTVTLMLMPVALSLTTKANERSLLLLATAYGASIGGILTPIGTAPNMLLIEFLEAHQLHRFGFVEWIVLVLPLVGLMLFIMPRIILWGRQNSTLIASKSEALVMTKDQKKVALILLIMSFVLISSAIAKMLFGVKLNDKMVLLGFGLLMFVPKIGLLEWEDSKKIPYEIVFLFGAGFAIASAIAKSGLAAQIAQSLSALDGMPLLVIFLLIAAFVAFSTEITSNTALTSIALPIIYELAAAFEGPVATIVLMIVAVSASYAFMLPIATPPNAIIMSYERLSIALMAKRGFVLNAIAVVLVGLVAHYYWAVIL